MTKTFWLSFADETGNLGVCVVTADAAQAALERPRMPPQAQPGAEWLAAALRLAWSLQINPGGEVEATEIDPRMIAQVGMEQNRLYSKAEVEAFEKIQ